MKKTFEQIQAALGHPVAGSVTHQRVAEATREGAQEEKNRWRYVFDRIPVAQQKLAMLLLGDKRCTLTPDEFIAACNVGHDAPSAAPIKVSDQAPALTREQELGALAIMETCRLLGRPIPTSLPEIHAPIPVAGRPGVPLIDPALQAEAEALAKRLGPITCQS
jgi:hypothetical protein